MGVSGAQRDDGVPGPNETAGRAFPICPGAYPASGIAVAQLPVLVEAPALHLSGVEQRAGVEIAGSDRDCGPARTQRDGGETVTHRSASVAVWLNGLDPQLSLVVGAPTFHGGVVEQRTREIALG